MYVWEGWREGGLDLYGADSKRFHGDGDDWLNRDSGYSDIIMRDKFGHGIIHSRAFFSLRFPLDYGLCGREPGRAKIKSILAFLLNLT